MKKIFFFAAVVLIAACGKKYTNQQKAESLITNYLEKTLSAPASYRSVAFDTLREQHDSFLTAEPEGRRLDSLATAYSDSANIYKKKEDSVLMSKMPDMKIATRYASIDTSFVRKSDSVSKIIQAKSQGYVGKTFHYIVNHTYKANNNLGKLTQHTTTFWISSDLTKVEHTQESN